MIRALTLSSAALLLQGTVLDSDPNSNLFSRMLPIFDKEEEESIIDHKKPILGGETEFTLEEATQRVQKLVDEGVLGKDESAKLLNSLHYAERVRQIASLMDGAKSALSK